MGIDQIRNLRQRKYLFLAAVAALSVISIFLGLSLGSVPVSVSDILGALFEGPGKDTEDIGYTILWTLRFPRVLLAFIEGASLGIAGAAMQGLFRNRLLYTSRCV